MSKTTHKPIPNNVEQIQKSKTLCLYFELHQPFRLNLPDNYAELEKKLQSCFTKNLQNKNLNQKEENTIQSEDYARDFATKLENFTLGPSGSNPGFLYGNEKIFDKICTVSYLPGLTFWLQMMEKLPNLKLTLGLSGTFLEQLENSKFDLEIVEIIKNMLKTGRMELLAETYYHSISSLFTNFDNPSELEKNEFIRQIKLHTSVLQRIFDYTPTSFRNTELIFNPQIGQIIQELNYKVQVISKPKNTKIGQKSVNLAILKNENENLDKKNNQIISQNNINQLTQNKDNKNNLKLALANFEATMFFFFTHRNDEFKEFFRNYPDSLEVLGTDFEIFGEHNGNSIFDLWENLLLEIDNSWNFVSVSELATFEQKEEKSLKIDLEINLDKKLETNLTNNQNQEDLQTEATNSQNNSNSSEIKQNLENNEQSDNKNKLPIYQDIFDNSTTSWTNSTQSLVSWLGNSHQDHCFAKLQEIYYKLKNLDKIGKLDKINPNSNKDSKNIEQNIMENSVQNDKSNSEFETQFKTQIWDFFGKLSTSDNFYYMSDLPGDDGKLHAIFNAYPSPLIAFETFWRILNFFEKYLQTLE